MTNVYPVMTVGFLLHGYSLAMLNAAIENASSVNLPEDFEAQIRAGKLEARYYDPNLVDKWLCSERKNLDLQILPCFSGEATTFDDVLCGEDGLELMFQDEQVVFLPLAYEAVYTGPSPYATTDEMVDEIQGIFQDLLPEDFPIAKYLCKITGTYRS